MVLHDLDSPDIIVADAVSGDAVFAAEQVGAFYVEFVDVLALILDFAALRNINAGHTAQHIADGAVLRLRETAHVVGNRISLLTYAVCLYRHLFQHSCPGFHIDGERKRNAVEW